MEGKSVSSIHKVLTMNFIFNFPMFLWQFISESSYTIPALNIEASKHGAKKIIGKNVVLFRRKKASGERHRKGRV